jgi:peptide/nickel transport system permease protein
MASGMLHLSPERERADDEDSLRRGVSPWRRLAGKPGFWFGAAALALLLAATAGAPLITSADPAHAFRDGGLSAAHTPMGPNERFPLGTDRLGRDYLSRLLYGGRVSLAVGIGASMLATAVGVAVGVVAGTAATPWLRIPLGRGQHLTVPLPVESLLMRVTDAVLAFPALLLAIALVAIVGPSLLLVTMVIAAFLWTFTARIVYARVKSLTQRQFVEAARALGVSPMRLVTRHLLPHTASVVFAYAALGVSAAILFEATLSYLGVGVPLPTPSWGSMIADHINYYSTDPRLLLLPGGAITVTILSFNLMGDALRDAFDPLLVGSPERRQA